MSYDDLIELGQNVGDPEPTELTLPAVDNEHWASVKNLRPVFDRHRPVIRLRGGSKEAFEDFANSISPENIIKTHCFEARMDGNPESFIAFQNTDKHIGLYNITTGQKTTWTDLGLTEEVDFVQYGEFLFFAERFKTDGKTYVANLYKKEYYSWMSRYSGKITSYEWMLKGDLIDQNIFDFNEDRQLIIILNSPKGVSGTAIPPSSEDHKTPEIFASKVPHMWDTVAMRLDFDDPYTRDYGIAYIPASGGQSAVQYDSYPVPFGPDTDKMTGTPAAIYFDEADDEWKENDNFQVPTVSRSYVIVDMMDDGSALVPGKPITVSMKCNEYFEVDANDRHWLRGAVKLNVPAAQPNVARRFVYATRWQLEERDCYIPSRPEYPNSPYYLAQEANPSETSIIDETPDRELLRPITEKMTMAAGVSAIFRSDQIVPQTSSGFKQRLIFAGYQMKQIPVIHGIGVDANIEIEGLVAPIPGEDPPPTYNILIYFFYTNGKRSETFVSNTGQLTEDGEVFVTIFGLNATVDRVLILVKDEDENLYKSGDFNSSKPEFHGFPHRIPIESDLSAFEQTTEPSEDLIETELFLPGHAMFSMFPQQVPIESQTQVTSGRDIIHLIPFSIDEQRGNVLRYQFHMLTSEGIDTGYILEQDTPHGIVYQSDFETIDPRTRCLKNSAAVSIRGAVYFASDVGISVISGNRVQAFVDKNRYPAAQNRFLNVLQNGRHDEMWLIFSGSPVLVWDFRQDGFRRYEMNGLPDLVYAFSFNNHLYLATDSGVLYETDLEDFYTDAGEGYSGIADTEHLSRPPHQVLVDHLYVGGDGLLCTPKIDFQRSRRIDRGVEHTNEFSNYILYQEEALKASGTHWLIGNQGPMPRVRIELEHGDGDSQGFMDFILLEHHLVMNRGITKT